MRTTTLEKLNQQADADERAIPCPVCNGQSLSMLLTPADGEVLAGTGAAGMLLSGCTGGGGVPIVPDGSKIVFSRDAGFQQPDIYIVNLDGSGVTRLTRSNLDCNPALSPDRKRIVFMSERDDPAGEIYIMNADGSNQTRVTTGPRFELEPAFSPDGTQIAFQSTRDSSGEIVGNPPSEIYKMNADGSNQIRLTNYPLDDGYPDWR